MILVSSIPIDPIKVPHVFQGKPCEFSIRPLDAEIMTGIQEGCAVYEFAPSPITGKLEKVNATTDAALDLALYAHIVAGWTGFVDGKKRELPVTPKNILAVTQLKPGKGELSLSVWFIRTARELGEKLHAEQELEIKNS